MGSLEGGSPVPVLGPTPLPDKRAGNLADLKFPALDLRGWETDLTKLSPDDRAKFVHALEERVNALRTLRDMRSLGEDKIKEADAANEASIKRRDEQLAELFRANPTLKALFDRMERTLEQQIAAELPRREEGTAIGSARLIRAALEGMPPDTATVFQILRGADSKRLGQIRESFRSTMHGAAPADKQIEMYLDGLKGVPENDRELLLRLFGGKRDDFEGTAVAALLLSKRPSGDPGAQAQYRMLLRGELSNTLGDNPEEIDRRIAAFNRMAGRRDLLERWLEHDLRDSTKLKEFREWEASITGEAGKKSVLFDRWIRRGGLTPEQSARFEAYVSASLAKEPDHFARAVESQFGAGTQYVAWLNARRAGNAQLADAIMLVEAVHMEKAPPRDVLMHLIRMSPEDRKALAEAYYQKFGTGNAAYASDHSKCLFDAIVDRRDRSQPDQWSDATRSVLAAYLSGKQLDQKQLEVDLAVSALGFRPGMKEGEIARMNPGDFNFLLQGKDAEERKTFIAQVEAQIGRSLITPDGEKRIFNIDTAKPGAAIEAYMARYSDREAETVTVLTVQQTHLDDIRRLSTAVNNQGLAEGERRAAAVELSDLNTKMEAERIRFKRAEEQLRRGEISALPSDLADKLKYFDKNTITTIDRRSQWTQLIRTLISEGSQDDRRVSQYILRVEGGDPRSRQLMEYARMLDGDISNSVMSIRGTTSNLIRSWSEYDHEFRWGCSFKSGWGFFSYMSGAKAESERMIHREEGDVERRMGIFVETQERTKKALAGMAEQSRAYQALEIQGNVLELRGDYAAAQHQYNQAQLAYRKAEEEILKAHNKSVEERVRQNQKMIHELAESNERLTKVDQTLAGYQDAIVKTGVILGATAACVATAGSASVLAMGAMKGFALSTAAGTGMGAAVSVVGRSAQFGWDGRADKIGGKDFALKVVDDTYDAFVASVGARAASGVTQARSAAAATRGQMVAAHVKGNLVGAGTMFAGNTGKSVATVYGLPFGLVEGALDKRARELGHPLTAEQRQKVFEEYRLTAGQLARDAFTYTATAWVGGKISGHTQALGGTFHQLAPGVTKHVAYDPGLWTRALGATNFVGQTGVAIGGNALNYAYYVAGLESEFHFDAGLLLAPIGNLSFGGPRGNKRGAPAGEHPAPSGGGHGPGGEHHGPATPHAPVGVNEHATPNARRRVELEGMARGLEAEAAAHGADLAKAREARSKAAELQAEGGRLQVEDAHTRLSDAKQNGTRAQVLEAEANLHTAQKVALDREQAALNRKKPVTTDPVALADLAKEQVALDKRRVAHAEDVLSAHREAHAEPMGDTLVARRQLELDAAQARLTAHESEHPILNRTELAKRARLEAEVAKASTERCRADEGHSPSALREMEGKERAARERQIQATTEAHAERAAAGEKIPANEVAALKRLKSEHAADTAAAALRQDIADHPTPTEPERKAIRSRLIDEELTARKAALDIQDAQGKKATPVEKAELEVARKTYERDVALAEVEGHRASRQTAEQRQRNLANSERELLRAAERHATEQQRLHDSSRARGEAVDPVKQARTTEALAQVEARRAQQELASAEAALKRLDEKAGPPTRADTEKRARLAAEIEQRRLILDHEQKAAEAAKLTRTAAEMERNPTVDAATVALAKEQAAIARTAEDAARPHAEAAHQKLIAEARKQLAEAVAKRAADSDNPTLKKSEQRAEQVVLQLEANAAKAKAESAARELQRHCIEHPVLADTQIAKRFDLEAKARAARTAQAQADLNLASAQHGENMPGADKRMRQAKERKDTLEADARREPERRTARENEAAVRKGVVEAEAAVAKQLGEATNAEKALAAHKELLAGRPDLAADPVQQRKTFDLQETAIQAREAYEDVSRNHRLLQMREELATAKGSRRNELERAIARAEADARELPAQRAEAKLERFGRQFDGALADPLTDKDTRNKMRAERHALEDHAHETRSQHLNSELELLRREIRDLPPTRDSHERHMALKRKVEALELSQAETAARKAEQKLKRDQTAGLEKELESSGWLKRQPKMEKPDWQKRHQLMEAELKAREALLERRLADATTKHGDESHPVVQRLAAELAETRAAAAHMGTHDKPGKYFAAEQARHAFEVAKAPVEHAQAFYNSLIAKHGFDPAKWSPDATRQIRQAQMIVERAIERTGIQGRRRQVEALEKQVAWEAERDKAIRKELRLQDTDSIPALTQRGWGEDRAKPVGRSTGVALEEARALLRQQEHERWGRPRRLAIAGLTIAGAGLFIHQLCGLKEQLGNLWNGLDFYDNDNGYMFGRSDDGGPLDEMMYSKLATAKPEEYLGIAREHLRLALGSILSDDDIERFAKRIVASGNGGVPSQMAIRDIVLEADSLATDARTIQRLLTERTSVPAPPPRPVHGQGGFYDLERLKAEGLFLPTRDPKPPVPPAP